MNLGEEAKKGGGVQANAVCEWSPEPSNSIASGFGRSSLHVSLGCLFDVYLRKTGSTMDAIYYPDKPTVQKAIAADDPLCLLVSHSGERAIVANIDEVADHNILLKKAGFPAQDIDAYFRVVVNKSGASWTFVCPDKYINIPDRTRRITRFYENGIDEISRALKLLEYDVPIDIPARYRRHLNELRDNGSH